MHRVDSRLLRTVNETNFVYSSTARLTIATGTSTMPAKLLTHFEGDNKKKGSNKYFSFIGLTLYYRQRKVKTAVKCLDLLFTYISTAMRKICVCSNIVNEIRVQKHSFSFLISRHQARSLLNTGNN